MKFEMGGMPKWKGKPKVSPLDGDVEFQKLRDVISGGTMKPLEYAGLYVNEVEDAKRLGTKHPARLVRDHLRRFLHTLRFEGLDSNYRLICRQTDQPGVWAVGVVREPHKTARTKQAALSEA